MSQLETLLLKIEIFFLQTSWGQLPPGTDHQRQGLSPGMLGFSREKVGLSWENGNVWSP